SPPAGFSSDLRETTLPQRPVKKNGDNDSIKVFVRVRPLTQDTGLTTDGDQNLCLTVTSNNTIRLHSKPEPRTFTYDHVADMDVSQDSVFAGVAKNIVESCMNGYNGTIFAYGQTGSGKTFTMLGPSDSDNFTDELRGVIPRSFEYLFSLINKEVERSKSFLCKCSFIEIYNEQIYDLLDSASATLFLRENIKKGVFVEGAVEKFVTSASEAYQVLSMGWRNRRVASTSMNRESSRSHAVFTMALESKETVNKLVNIRTSQLNLVDLAGSERQKDTHTEGSRLKEASSINLSLMCLGQVIMSLVDVANGKNRHICYRDSKLTFLLRDSLGGNAKTYIIANVHPGSKCFGETLSTLQFAQRAKLIKNKAMINEDSQGNVRQLQAEVKKLKELLAAQTSMGLSGRDLAPGGPRLSSSPSNEHPEVSYKGKFLQAIGLWKKREDEKTLLLQKVAQLEEARSQKEKFIHSSRMIVKFREDHISRLEKKLKGDQVPLLDKENEVLVDQLKAEITVLKDQMEHHPKISQYAAENYSLRQENRYLRSLESVTKAEEAAGQAAVELEEAFRLALEHAVYFFATAQPAFSTPAAAESVSAVSVERLKAQLLQKQSELSTTSQAFEEYKELTKKQIVELESEKRYLDKSIKHLENILEATHSCKKQEVLELNRIHVETIKNLTTPTKAYNLRSRNDHLSSPEHLNGDEMNDIRHEQPPPEMTELACEALTEELQQVQEQADRVQTQLAEEEMKGTKLLQQIAKLDEQVALMGQELGQSYMPSDCPSDSLSLFVCSSTWPVLRSEIQDLRVVLQSSDKELAAVKSELRDGQGGHQREMSQLSSNLIRTQLQLDKVQLEWEQLLLQHRSLQDSFDHLQAESKFEADQAGQQLQESQQEAAALRDRITEMDNSLQIERAHTNTLSTQLWESTSKCGLSLPLSNLSGAVVQGVVLELINQTRELRSELSGKEENLAQLSGDIKDLTAKCNAVTSERDEVREQNSRMQTKLQDLKGDVEKKAASSRIEVELLQDEVLYATEEVERLTKVLDEQNGLLQSFQEQTTQKDSTIQSLQQQVLKKYSKAHGALLSPCLVLKTPCTPRSVSKDLSQILELESRRSSMMTMELLLTEQNSERADKNAEIQRLKVLWIFLLSTEQTFYYCVLFCSELLNEAIKQTMLRELQEERAEKVCLSVQLSSSLLQAQESMLAQSQTCVQELTSELRNRCLELRELSLREQEQEKLLNEVEVLRKQVDHLSEENGKLVGHKNHKQRIEYLVKLKKENSKLQEPKQHFIS
uniref:Kinesin motor domain-containing protein n=1 Tax=Gadus morhua TaxID=8049 RepID=A0A8C5A4L8_GADMO